MAIRKTTKEINQGQFEKDIYATDVDGKVTTTVISRQRFTIADKEREIVNLNNGTKRNNEIVAELQADIAAAKLLK